MQQASPLWVTLATVALGGVVSAVVSALLSLRHARSARRLEKLEELCVVLTELKIAAFRGEAAFRGGFDKSADKKPGLAPEKFLRAQILVALYIPTMRADFTKSMILITRGVVAANINSKADDERVADVYQEVLSGIDRVLNVALDAANPRLWDQVRLAFKGN